VSEPRRIHVAYLASHYPTVSHTFILREVRALRELGVDVDTFAIWRSPAHQVLSRADREEAERTFSLLPLRPGRLTLSHLAAIATRPGAYASMVRRAFGLARPGRRGLMLAASWVAEAPILWRELRRRGIHHVHAHLNGTGPAVAMLATELAGNAHTWSMTVHGPAEFYEVANDGLAEKVRSADFGVCISDFGRSQLMAFVGEEHWDKLHVVHCGVEPDSRAARNRPEEHGLSLLSVGRLTQVKGHGVLFEALADLRSRGLDARLVVVGDGPKRQGLERLAAEMGLDGAVRFTGAVGQDEIRAHYEAADVFAHASFAEGIPVVLMEAMAHRLPVVATRVMGVGELVRDGEIGLVVRPARPDPLSEALDRLAGDPALRERLGDAGRRTVEAEFDVRSSAAQMRELFERYVSKTASTTRSAERPSSSEQ
jgi:colanic acid/amylovoran biosynthesis glycosyltransferase